MDQAARTAGTLREPIRVVVDERGGRGHDAAVIRQHEFSTHVVRNLPRSHGLTTGNGWIRRRSIDVVVDLRRRRSERVSGSLSERRRELNLLIRQRRSARINRQRIRRSSEIFGAEPGSHSQRGEQRGVRRELGRNAVEVRP